MAIEWPNSMTYGTSLACTTSAIGVGTSFAIAWLAINPIVGIVK